MDEQNCTITLRLGADAMVRSVTAPDQHPYLAISGAGVVLLLVPAQSGRVAQSDLDVAELLRQAVQHYHDACYRAVAQRRVFRDWPEAEADGARVVDPHG